MASKSDLEAIENTGTLAKCFTCDVVKEISDISSSFSSSLYDVLVVIVEPMFVGMATIWAILVAARLLLGIATAKDIVVDFVFITLAYFLLAHQGKTLVLTAFDLILEAAGGLSLAALTVALESNFNFEQFTGENSFLTMIRATEDALVAVIYTGVQIAKETSLSNPIAWLYGLALIVPYFLILIAFTAQILVLFVRLTNLMAFSSLLLLAYGFKWGRGMAISAFKTAIASSIVLLSTAIVISMILFAVFQLGINEGSGDAIDVEKLLSAQFLVALILGWLGPAAILASTELANSITGAKLSNTATGIMTAGISGSVYTIAKTAAGGGGNISASLFDGLAKTVGMKGASEASGSEKLGYVAGAAGHALAKGGSAAYEGAKKARNLIGK